MGLLKKLFNTGLTVGATVAAVKVAEKYKANNPDGVEDVNGDGKTDGLDVLAEVKRAAGEVYQDAADYVKENGPKCAEKVQNTASNIFGGTNRN